MLALVRGVLPVDCNMVLDLLTQYREVDIAYRLDEREDMRLFCERGIQGYDARQWARSIRIDRDTGAVSAGWKAVSYTHLRAHETSAHL
eukprot:9160473-Alexandrium_andersonii.AAC.1